MMHVPLEDKSHNWGDLFPAFLNSLFPALLTLFISLTAAEIFGNNFTIGASYLMERSPRG
jgi:hypothetical protein